MTTITNTTTITIVPDGSGDLSVTYSVSGGGGGGNGMVGYNWDPSTQLPNYNAALAAGGNVKIICYGDSTTQGDGASVGQAWPNRLAVQVSTLLSMNANYANFSGIGEVGYQMALAGSAYFSTVDVAGADLIVLTTPTTDTATWTPETGRLSTYEYDRIDVYYLETGSYEFNVVLTGAVHGTSSYTVTCPSTVTGAETKTTFTVPLDTYSVVEFVCVSVTGSWCQITGVGFWNSGANAIQTYNLGIGGSQSSVVDISSVSGSANMLQAAVNRGASLAIIDYCLNDMLFNNVTLSTSISNLTTAVSTLQANNIDVILCIPHPFINSTGLYTIGQFITAMQSLATTLGIGVLDWNSTYANDPGDFATTFIDIGVHPNALGYDAMATRLASALTGVSTTYPDDATYVAAHPMTNIPPGALV
jgi:lysophospholipase L1-like esterase